MDLAFGGYLWAQRALSTGPTTRLLQCRHTIAVARMVRLLDFLDCQSARKGLSRFVVPNTPAAGPSLAAQLRDAYCYGGQQQQQL